ncbi:centriole and centriolar satellite protein ofd1 isoform X2 [Labrus bergylta]|uniref:centriole and centriolar satellite protein ofd1 isoform X2 n=1 Tax=Labrus bergylta TaxID=56723 RepID=UPI003313ABC2
MSSTKEDALSPDELRRRLYQTFRNKGVLDSLKTQLRNQLIQELKHPPLAGAEPVPRPVPVKSEPLLVSACNNIVADHLRTSGYEYTLSVFYPESGLSKEKVSTKGELLQLLRISPESALYRSLSLNKDDNGKGFLISLLTQPSPPYTHGLCHDADTQTPSVGTYGESLVDKMKMIDKEYESISYSGEKWFSIESKLAAYRKETDAQMQAEMNTKMQHFKDVEIATMRMEEKATFHKEFDKLKQDLERTYEMKAKALMEREKNAIDRLQKQQEIEEKNVYIQRQSVLKEIETQRNRENELRMRTEAFEKTSQIQEDKIKTTEELLRRRELAVKSMEDTYDQRLKNDLCRYQLELKEDFTKRTEKLSENENRNKDLGKPSKEQMSLQMELRRLQSTRRLDEEEFDNQKQVLQAQLQSEVERSAQLKAQLIQCEEKSQWMSNHIEDIKMQLCQTQRALENEVLRNPKPSLVDRSVLDLSADKLVPPDVYVDRALLRSKVVYDGVCEAGGPSRGHDWPRSDSPDSDMDLVADAKARIQELQKEADILEEAYRSYQQRAVCSTLSHMLPPRALSPQQAHPSRHPDSLHRKLLSHHSHTHAPHKSKVAHRPLSPQTTRTPSSLPYTTKNSVPPAQLRVTFSEDQNQPQSPIFPDHSLHLLTEPLTEEPPQNGSSSPSRRLSSTPRSSSRRTLQREIIQEAVMSAMAFPELSSGRQPPQAPRDEVATSGDFFSEHSPPYSPQLKSTARDQTSPPELQPVVSSLESSPQPEKISLEDLGQSLSEPSHIPELLPDTAVPLSEEAPDGPAVSHPQDLPEDPKDSQGLAVTETSVESAWEKEEEEEEQRWERERKDRQEQRQREQEEARERELQELKRLEEETLLQEVEITREEQEDKSEMKIGDGEQNQEADNKEEEKSKGENPLEKYMKLVLEAKDKQHAPSPGRDETGHSSPEVKSLSEEKDNSIAAYSHKDEDDFW